MNCEFHMYSSHIYILYMYFMQICKLYKLKFGLHQPKCSILIFSDFVGILQRHHIATNGIEVIRIRDIKREITHVIERRLSLYIFFVPYVNYLLQFDLGLLELSS